jgi:hypothetical protein
MQMKVEIFNLGTGTGSSVGGDSSIRKSKWSKNYLTRQKKVMLFRYANTDEIPFLDGK